MTTRRDTLLISSLSNYVKDVKPFHTKLKEFLSELRVESDTSFNPRINVTIQDSVRYEDVAPVPIPMLGYGVGGYDTTPYDALP